MLKIIACDDDVAFLDNLHRMINRWSAETGTAVDVALVTRGEDLLARHAASRADIIMLDMIMPLATAWTPPASCVNPIPPCTWYF